MGDTTIQRVEKENPPPAFAEHNQINLSNKHNTATHRSELEEGARDQSKEWQCTMNDKKDNNLAKFVIRNPEKNTRKSEMSPKMGSFLNKQTRKSEHGCGWKQIGKVAFHLCLVLYLFQ